MNNAVEKFHALIESVKNAHEAQLEDFLHAYILIIFFKQNKRYIDEIRQDDWEALASQNQDTVPEWKQEKIFSNLIGELMEVIKIEGLQAAPLERLDKTELYNILFFVASYPFEKRILRIALKELYNHQKKHYKGGGFVPIELKEFIHELVKETVKGKDLREWRFYDPVARLGDIADLDLMESRLQPKEVYLNCQLSLDYQISKILLTLLLPNSSIYVSNSNALESNQLIEQNIQVDIVASLPSFGPYADIKNDQPYIVDALKRVKRKTSYEAASVQLALHVLNSEGIAMIVVPDGLLVRRGDGLELRKHLINNGHIKAIISLPSNLLRPVAKTSLLILQKSGKVGQPIKIIQVKRQLGRMTGKAVSDILIHNDVQFEEKVQQCVTYKEIKPDKIESYNLNPSYYLEQGALSSNLAFNHGEEKRMPQKLERLRKEYFERKEALEEAMRQWEKVISGN